MAHWRNVFLQLFPMEQQTVANLSRFLLDGGFLVVLVGGKLGFGLGIKFESCLVMWL